MPKVKFLNSEIILISFSSPHSPYDINILFENKKHPLLEKKIAQESNPRSRVRGGCFSEGWGKDLTSSASSQDTLTANSSAIIILLNSDFPPK